MKLTKLKVVTATVIILMILVSGCAESSTIAEPTTQSTTQPSINRSTSSLVKPVQTYKPPKTAQPVQTVSEAANQNALLDSVVMGTVSTMSKNWDADAENDGIVVYPNLKDAADQTVKFENVEMPIELKIYTTKFDDDYKEINDRLLYTGSSKINSWKDGNFIYAGGIKIPYDQITSIASDQPYGRLYVIVTLPDGRRIESKDDSVRIKQD